MRQQLERDGVHATNILPPNSQLPYKHTHSLEPSTVASTNGGSKVS